MFDSRIVTFKNACAVRETAKGLLVRWDGGDGPGDHWLPKSQIDVNSQVRKLGDLGDLVVSGLGSPKLYD
jgi:hypothetical protein